MVILSELSEPDFTGSLNVKYSVPIFMSTENELNTGGVMSGEYTFTARAAVDTIATSGFAGLAKSPVSDDAAVRNVDATPGLASPAVALIPSTSASSKITVKTMLFDVETAPPVNKTEVAADPIVDCNAIDVSVNGV